MRMHIVRGGVRAVLAGLLAAAAATVLAADCLDEVGWWGYNQTYSMVAGADGPALLTSGELLLTAEIDDPAQPGVIGQARVGREPRALAVADGLGWVATTAGLVVVDVSEPEQPQALGQLGIDTNVVVPLAPGFVAIGNGQRLHAVDATDPTAPVLLAGVAVGGPVLAAARAGSGLVAVADGTGLAVVDASDPTALRLVGRIELEDGSRRVAADGARVFVTASSSARLYVVDISSPAEPQLLASTAGLDQAIGVALVAPATLVVADSDSLQTLDVSPGSPPRLEFHTAPGGLFTALVARGSTAWLARRSGGAQAVDVGNPAAPQLAGTLEPPALVVLPVAVAADGDIVVATDAAGGGRLRVVDAAAVPDPTELARVELPGNTADGLAMAGHLALVTYGTCEWGEHGRECSDGGLAVVDLAEPTSPVVVALAGDVPAPARLIVAGDGFALLEGGWLQVVDLAEPTAPVLRSTVRVGVEQLAVDGRRAFYTDGDGQLCALDLSDLAAPVELGCADRPGDSPGLPTGLAVAGGLAAVAVEHPGQVPPGDPELWLFDVTQAAAPVVLGTFESWSAPGVLALADGTVLLDAGDRLLAIDVGDPSRPVLLGFSFPGRVNGLAFADGPAVAAFDDGLALLDLASCGSSPPQVDFAWSPPLPALGEAVEFADRSAGPATSWSWDFGDGATASAAAPAHAFATPGTHRVTLTAGNALGSDVASHDVTVQSIATPLGFTAVIPAAAHLDGLAGTTWRTDVELTQLTGGSAPLPPTDAVLYFMPRGGDNTLAGGHRIPLDGIVRLADVVGTNFGAGDAAGAILVTAERPIGVTSRTATGGVDGSYGQLVPPPAPTEVVSDGGSADLLLLAETDARRSNLGAANLTGHATTMVVDLLDGAGVPLGVVQRELPPYGSLQLDRVLRLVSAAPVEHARAVVRTLDPADRVAVYASVVDNRTGDPIFVAPAAVSTEPLFVPAVAHLAGHNGTLWRSELEVCALADTGVRIELWLRGSDPPATPPSVDFLLAAGGCVRSPDVVSELFGRGGAGALRIVPDTGAVIAASRTYTSGDAGSYGQLVPAIPAARVPSQEAWRVQGLRESADPTRGFRSNLGLLNLEDHEVEVYLRLGGAEPYTTLREESLTLAPHEQRQLDRVLAGLGEVDAASALVTVPGIWDGSRVIVYGSLVDNVTGDPSLLQGW